MRRPAAEDLENRAYWERLPCGAGFSARPQDTLAYFEQVEAERRRRLPGLEPFAERERQRGRRVLEVGTGLGSDLVAWCRAGADARGVDLTRAAVRATRRNLQLRGLDPERALLASAEALPFADGSFDLVWSWGVLHHTARVERALDEVVRVLAPGGEGRLMVYHRCSLVGGYLWLRHALLAGRPWRDLDWCFSHGIQNQGTRAYSPGEVEALLCARRLARLRVRAALSTADRLEQHGSRALTLLAGGLARLLGGDRAGLYLLVAFEKPCPAR